MSETVTRAFALDELEAGDGRTIVGRCVPYDIEREVADPPEFVPYREVWRAGAFRHVVRAPNRVLLNYDHRDDLGNQVGLATELVERDDGLHAVFRAYDTTVASANTALAMVREHALRGLSIQATMHPRGTNRDGGLVERVRVAMLHHVALTATPAYDTAEVLAVRSAQPGLVDPTPPAVAETLDYLARARAKYQPS